MKEMPSFEFEQLINNVSYESRHLEFKSGFNWSDNQFLWLKEKIAKTVIAMSNTRHGGQIVLGIRENNKKLVFVGLNQQQLNSFYNYDAIKLFIDEYIFLNTKFDIYKTKYKNKDYVVIKVYEFNELPLITVKKGIAHKANGRPANIINKDLIYIRSRDGVQVTQLGYQEMIEVITLAAEKINMKQLQNYKDFCECEPVSEQEQISINEVIDRSKNVKVIDKIKSKGYWQIYITPNIEVNIKRESLRNTLYQSQIIYKDETLPIITPENSKGAIMLGNSNNLVNFVDYSHFKEFTSLNTTSDSIILKACKNDWIEDYFSYNKLKVQTKPLKSIYLAEIVNTITLTYFYTHNLCSFLNSKEEFYIHISLNNTIDRVLLIDNSDAIKSHKSYINNVKLKTYSVNMYNTKQLLLKKSFETIKSLLTQFNFKLTEENLKLIKQLQNNLM